MRAAGVQLIVITVACGCGPAPADRLTDDSTAPPATSPATPAPRAPGPLATRHEAQQSFDRARAALIRKDYPAAVAHLADAAEFMRSHAAHAELGAIAALQGSAKELEFLAERLSKGETPTIRSLDRVLANANRAEAQHHLTRALAALTDRDSRDAGEELLMAMDHLERAARDLRYPYDAQATPALSEARAFASRLLRGGSVTRAESKRVTGQLAEELRRVCQINDVEARACAVEAAR